MEFVYDAASPSSTAAAKALTRFGGLDLAVEMAGCRRP